MIFSRVKACRIWAVLLVCFSLTFFFLRTCLAASAKMQFTVSLDKSEYKQNEPIYATFKLQNKDKNSVYVNKRFYVAGENTPNEIREVYLIVTSPSGAKLECKYSYEIGLPKSEYFELLEPGKEVTSEYKRDLRSYFDFKETGIYKIVAVYQNVYGKEIGLDTFKDKVTSEPVSIKITP